MGQQNEVFNGSPANFEPKDTLEFLIADYGHKIGYLTNHFGRVWQRFNFFITLESGLSAALWARIR